MKQILSFLFFVSLTLGVVGQDEGKPSAADCQQFHTGTFVMAGEKTDGYIFKRNKKYQVEQLLPSKKKFKFKIEWMDDCTYVLTPANPKKYAGPADPVTVEIIAVDGNDYTIIAFIRGKQVGEERVITRVK